MKTFNKVFLAFYLTFEAFATPPQLIIDTDMALDVDDVGAVCIGHALERRGLVELKGVVYNTGVPNGIKIVSAINNYFNRGEITIGAYKGEFHRLQHGVYVDQIARDFKSLVTSNESQLNKSAVQAYREILASADDRSIVIASIGFTNNLADLLKSEPDEISYLSGKELVKMKVKHLSLMGGEYPKALRPEFNFAFYGEESKFAIHSTDYLLKNWPSEVPVIFNGFEIGSAIQTGQKMVDANLDLTNPCAKAYRYYCDRGDCDPLKGRASWDLVTVLHSVFLEDANAWENILEGNESMSKILAKKNRKWTKPWGGKHTLTEEMMSGKEVFVPWARRSGKNFIKESGSNRWEDSNVSPNEGMHYLWVKAGEYYGVFEDLLDELLQETNPDFVPLKQQKTTDLKSLDEYDSVNFKKE